MEMKRARNEQRTENIMVRVRPSVKRIAVAMAKAEDRSLSSFISRLIEDRAGSVENTTGKKR
jgi:predicted HicB family RNase H-like nuclease